MSSPGVSSDAYILSSPFSEPRFILEASSALTLHSLVPFLTIKTCAGPRSGSGTQSMVSII